MSTISIRLREGNLKIESLIVGAIKDHVRRSLFSASLNIERRLRNMVGNLITAQPEWASLENGRLAAEFGLDNASSRLSTILDIWVGSISVRVKAPRTTGNQLNAGLSIQMIRSKWDDVLNTNAAVVFTDKGVELPWLQWLLTEGDKIIVRDYEVSYNVRPNMNSRSGLAVMIEKKKARWRVPPEFSGTTTNNFVTRALSGIQDAMNTIVENEIQRAL